MTITLHGWVPDPLRGTATSIRIDVDGVTIFVPDDENNRHRAQLAAWEAQGNVIPDDTGGAGIPLDAEAFNA
jgi:hypothetical protein